VSIVVQSDLDTCIHSRVHAVKGLAQSSAAAQLTPAILPPAFTSLQLMNRFTLQLVWQIVPMQLSHGMESRLACASHRLASTGLRHSSAFLSVLSPDVLTGASLTFPHKPASSDPEPDDQAEDDQ
jgi:hypothetical protein